MKSEAAGNTLTKEKLIEIIQGLLDTDHMLSFLFQLDNSDLQVLTACIRERVDRIAN